MEHLTLQTFKEKVFDFDNNKSWRFQGERPAIIDFYANWCGPCRMVSPILEELSGEYQGKIDIFKVNTEEQPELAGMFGIRSIPSLLFIPLNEEPQMVSGALPKKAFEEAITSVLKVTKTGHAKNG